ncbi:Transglycosylase SLT domain-containing protein [Carex littledalei]|uniref:Transglycosylase SLT domain-containing protein n=1 Tax=Carex littledalei TaxID=544730 RepID=A0A833QP56_9POAL|nr:Transglycosylase SLT domain-containing protein [Carex littledalei]
MPSFRYWDDCVDPDDMKVMWHTADVSKEWIDAGEKIGKKVHISRDPDGELYLTQTEMLAIAKLTIDRHFNSQLDPDMICALCEIVSDRKLFLEQYNKKLKETRVGLMQVAPETADWLAREMGYRAYEIEGNTDMLYRPFVNVYFGAAYIKWLSSCDGKERNEEFVIRAYKGGKKKAAHKSTLIYFQRYMSVKESLASKREDEIRLPTGAASNSTTTAPGKSGEEWAFWDARVSFEDMDAMWNNPEVVREWAKSGERRGRVRFSLDAQKKPYLSQVEVKAIAGIIIARHFSSRGVKASALAALAEVTSMRFVNGLQARTGLLGIDYPTALWLYNDVGYRAYKVISVDDLYNPFVSMYFGAAYLAYLSEYEGRQRSYEFIVQAFLSGPENVNLQETGPHWTKFQDTLRFYEDSKK